MRPLWHFLCSGSSKPIRGQWKALHCRSRPLPHSVTAELWKIDGLLSKTMSCFWFECFALISLNALEGSIRADMLTTSVLILVLSSTYCPASQISEGKKTMGRKGVRRDRSLSSLPPYGTPVDTHSVWRHALSRTHKVTRWLHSLAPGLQPELSKPSIQRDGGNTTTPYPQRVIKTPQPQRAHHLISKC